MSKFYQEIVKLKSVMRKGWKVDSVDLKVGRCESVAEHTFSATLLACEIMEREKLNHLDKYKVLKMVLIHDLCEIDKGDHTPFDNITNEEKFNTEVECIKRISIEAKMPEIYDLWIEFEEGKTEEAKFVKVIDKLEAIMQAKEYSKILNDNSIFNEFFTNSKDKIKGFEKYINN